MMHERSQPSMPDIWARIECVLEQHAPETARTLAPPATENEIAELQREIGLTLPDEFIDSLRVHNGQIDPTRLHSLCGEGVLSGTHAIAETWRTMTELDEDFRQTIPDWDTHPQGDWWNKRWVPFTMADGDSLCINLNPKVPPGCSYGEIVCHVHDNPHEPGIAPGYGAWLTRVCERLENGEFRIEDDGCLWLNPETEWPPLR
jgi:cell wall assembly regulator SMI1